MLQVKNIIFVIIMIYAGISDYRSRTIPDKVYPIILLSTFLSNFNLMQSITGLIVLSILFIIPVFKDYNSVGGGDIKLVGSISFFLGLTRGTVAVMIGLSVALVFNLWILKKDKSDTFPLAPYLAVGSIITLLI